MKAKPLRTLGLEIFKTLNNLNPVFVEKTFQRTKWLTHRPNNIQVNGHRTANYGGKT